MRIKDLSRQKIEDFGEKIGGAKKDLFAHYLSQMKEIRREDIIAQPLRKIFPPPNYKALMEEGRLSQDNAILLRYLYDSIPNKPRTRYRLSTWVDEVTRIIGLAETVLLSPTSQNRLAEYMQEHHSRPLQIFSEVMRAAGFPMQDFNMGSYGVRQNYDYTYYITKSHYIIRDRLTLAEVVEQIREFTAPRQRVAAKTKFNVYRNRGTGNIYITPEGKSNIILKENFASGTEAWEYIKTHQDVLEQIWASFKETPQERRNINRTRIGTDWRHGLDVTPQKFGDTFGFRGVEFGNWVNQDERQHALNEAYDALMDLSVVCGLTPNAISLNGELGLAFGARGSGMANAHYESAKVVINLTKTRGAGSLAHEWFHALDNYFSRHRNLPNQFLTELPRKYVSSQDKVAGETDPTRQELLVAFNGVRRTMVSLDYQKRCELLDKTKGRTYWATPIEMSARAFENFVIAKLDQNGDQNDYLANFKTLEEYIQGVQNPEEITKRYPYPLASEAETLNQAYQQLFDTIQEKVDQQTGKTLLFRETLDRRLEGMGVHADPDDTLMERKLAEVERLSKVLHTTIYVASDETALIGTREPQLFRNATGWYDLKTGSIGVILSNMSSVADVQATVLHEAVGHKGMRELFGEKYDDLLDNVWNSLDKNVQDGLMGKYHSTRIAADEYIASMAERDTAVPQVARIMAVIRDWFRSIGINLKISDRDIFYMLYKSKANLHPVNSLSAAHQRQHEKANNDDSSLSVTARKERKNGPRIKM